MVNVTIIIRGVGLVYPRQEEKSWKILFPFDDCHEVKFKTSETDPGIPLAKPGQKIRIHTVGEPASAFAVGADFEKFLDITSPQSHRNGIKAKGNPTDNSVLVTIENAKFSVFEFTRCRMQLMNAEKVVVQPKQIGYSGRADIKGEKVTIEVEGVTGFPKTFDEDTIIYLDNICPRQLSETILTADGKIEFSDAGPSDFEMLYEIIEDVITPEKKFIVDRDPLQNPGADGLLFTGVTLEDNMVEGEPGRPCNLFVASLSANLPT